MSTMICKQNDSGRDIEATIKLDGVIVPLTGTIKLVMTRSDFPGPVIKKDAVIVDGPNAKAKYTLLAADLAMPGTFSLEWEVTNAGGIVFTAPSSGWDTLVINPELG